MTQPFSPSFTNEKVDTGSGNLIPTGSLAWGVLSVRGLKNSQETQGQYADCELTILGGQWEGRKMFPMISSPFDERNKEGGRQMGFAAILHMVEAASLVNINDAASYAPLQALLAKNPDGSPAVDPANAFLRVMSALDGKAVAVKIGIKKDKDGAYPDKNQVSEWLSPNPTRSTHKAYQALAEGRSNMKPVVPGTPQGGAPAPTAGGAFGAAPATQSAAPVAAPAFAPPPPAQAAAPSVGPNAAPPAFLQSASLGQGGQSAPLTDKPPF